jgi:hypothetical protein
MRGGFDDRPDALCRCGESATFPEKFVIDILSWVPSREGLC